MIRNASLRVLALASCAGLAALGGCELTTIYIETASGGAGGATGTTSTSSSAGGTGGALLCTPGAVQPCYDGPAGTAGHGICRTGAQTCAADGGSWGPCAGSVLPQPENCATAEDEDCDGKAPPCKGSVLWAKGFGDALWQYGTAIAVAGNNHVLVAGQFAGTLGFGGAPLTSTSPLTPDLFVAELDAAGNHLWSKSFGHPADATVEGIAADAAGSVLVAGCFIGDLGFGGTLLQSPGSHSVFVAKLDATGGHLWSKAFGVGATATCTATVAVDGTGNVLLAGSFGPGSLNFGGGPLMSGASDVFIAKLDATSGHVWSKVFGTASSEGPPKVAVDSAGNVVVTGAFVGTVDFGGGPLQSAGGGDVFVVKLAANGSHVWSKRFGDAATQAGRGIATDGQNVVVTGDLVGTVDFGGGPLQSVGGRDVFAVKFSATDGSHVWSRRFGDADDQLGWAVAIDSASNVVMTGYFNGTMDFGDGPIQSAGGHDIFVAKLAGDGAGQWAKRFGDSKAQSGNSVAVDAAGNTYVVGNFEGSLDLGGGITVTSAGQSDVFIAAFGP